MRWRASLGVLGLTLLSGCTSGAEPMSPTVPGTSQGSTSQASPPSSSDGLTLTIVATYQPLCGGPEPTAPQTTCRPQAVADLQVTVRHVVGGEPGEVAATLRTNVAGTATTRVTAGDYLVVGGPAESPRVTPRPTPVTVAAGRAATVTLRYESSFQ